MIVETAMRNILRSRLSAWSCAQIRLASDRPPHAFEKIVLSHRDPQFDPKSLRDKAVLIFFSAGWCSSCKEFTPLLKQFYDHTKDKVEVVWVSRDRSAEDQAEYYEKNLPAWPYASYVTKDIRDLQQVYEIKTIPAIKLVNHEGEVVDDSARVKIEKNYADPEACKKIADEWRKKLNLQ